MIIAFTGHRDRTSSENELSQILAEFPTATWWCGDERDGFDRQVRRFADTHGIGYVMKAPEYEKYPADKARWAAQYARNREMVEKCDLLVACFSGKPKGGTAFILRYARKLGKPIRVIQSIS